VFVALAAEGYQVGYRRVPMSRERTPQAADLDQLLAQMGGAPADKEVRAGRSLRGITWTLSRAAGGSVCTHACACKSVILW
jgi:hypothetical protein